MLENLLNKFKLLHLLSYVQMFFCCTLHPYFPFHSEQAQTAACPQKIAENTQTNNYTVPRPITTRQTNKNWGGKLKLKSPKQVKPQLNWIISRAGLKRTYQHKYFDDLSSETPPLPLQGHKQSWITGKTFWSEVRQQNNALFLGVLTIKALQGKNLYKQNWDKISMFSRIF